MAVQTISQPNCLILLTITCTDDIQNQSGAALARKVDPKGLRTIGVLTKTDAIQEGDHPAWHDLLCGRRETLKYGYYAMKNPSTNELLQGIAYEDARRAERDFFQGQLWAQLPVNVQRRLGVSHLVSRLSALLVDLIQKQLPDMLANMKQTLAETQAKPQQLPEHVDEANCVRFVSDKGNAMAASVKAAVQGSHGTGSSALLREIRMKVIESFKNDILQSPPVFLAHVDSDWINAEKVRLYAITDEGEEGWFLEESLAGQKQRVAYTFREAHVMITALSGLQLPGNVPYELKFHLIQQSLEHLSHRVSVAFDQVKDAVGDFVNHEVQEYFGEYRAGGLFTIAESIWKRLHSECEAHTDLILEAMQECELSCIFTSNEAEYEQLAGEQLKVFQEARNQAPEQDRNVDDQALRLCAEVVAYYTLKSRTFVDIFPSIIITHYLRAIGDKIQDALSVGLEIHEKHAHKKCLAFLQQDEETESQRRELIASQARLEEGLKAMKKFGAA